MRLFMFAALLLATPVTFAAKSKACICEIGTQPANQHRAFSIGCTLWLNSQKECATKTKVDFGASYTNLPPEVTQLAVGYVGHANSSTELVNYLQTTISPLMSIRPISVYVDNTACRTMNHPDEVLSYIKSLSFPPGQTLVVRGNQVGSIGKWDVLIGSRYNFPATVSFPANTISYPACKQFAGYNCLSNVQLNEVGVCLDKAGALASLRCAMNGGQQATWQ
jgi:hypothetical protein